jgi:PleD family two-component response regulator
LFVPHITPGSIEKDIDNYINKIEHYTKQLEDNYNHSNTNEFIRDLENIQEMLQAVFAKQCEAYPVALIHAARTRGLDHCRTLLQQAIADFLLLSIEMQKAQNIGVNAMPEYKKIEKHEEILRNLAAIKRFMNAGDYTNALNMVSGIKDVEDNFVKLERILQSRDYKKAEELMKVMEEEHLEFINTFKVKGQKTVLAVDDRPEILNSVSAALRGHYKVLGAPDGRLALDIINQQRIDLFFLDIDMPEMDGFELARRIRSDRKHVQTPIIFLTGNASRDYILRAIKLGTNDFIVKPSNHVALLTRARKYMD